MHGPQPITIGGNMPASSHVDVYMESSSLELVPTASATTIRSSTPLNSELLNEEAQIAVKQENRTHSHDTTTLNYTLDPFPSSYSSHPAVQPVSEDDAWGRQQSQLVNAAEDDPNSSIPMQQQDAKVLAWNPDNPSDPRLPSLYPSSTADSLHTTSLLPVVVLCGAASQRPASPTAHVKSTPHAESALASHEERETNNMQTNNMSIDTLPPPQHTGSRVHARSAPSAATIPPSENREFHATSLSNRSHFTQQANTTHAQLNMPPSIASSEASVSSDSSSFPPPSSHPSSRGSSVALGRGVKREREAEIEPTLHMPAGLQSETSANSHDNVRIKLEQDSFTNSRRFTDSSMHTSVLGGADGANPAPQSNHHFAAAETNPSSRSHTSSHRHSHSSNEESAALLVNTSNGRRSSKHTPRNSVGSKASERMTIDTENVEDQRHRKMPRLHKDDTRTASPHSDPLSSRTIRESNSPTTANRKQKRQTSDGSMINESKLTSEANAVTNLTIPSTLVSPLIPTFARLSHAHLQSNSSSNGSTPKNSKRGSRNESSAGSSVSASSNVSPCHQSSSGSISASSPAAFSAFPTPSSKRATLHIPAHAELARPKPTAESHVTSSKQQHHSAATTPKHCASSHSVAAASTAASNSAKRPASKPETATPGKFAPSPAEDIWAPLPLPVGGVITGKGNGAAAGITIPNPVPGKRGGGFSCHCCKTSKRDIDDLFLCTNILPKDPYDHKCIAAANLAAVANMKAAEEAPVTSSKKKNASKGGKEGGSHKKSSDAPMEIARVFDAATLEEMKRSAALIKNCKKKYCTACMKRLYTEEYQMLFGSNKDQWCCPSCLNRCTCAGCERRIQGEDEAPWRKRKPDQSSFTEPEPEEKVKKEHKVKQEVGAASASIKKEKKESHREISVKEEVKVKKEKKEKEKEKEEEKKEAKPSTNKKKPAVVSSNPVPPSSNPSAVKQQANPSAPSSKSNKSHKPSSGKQNPVEASHHSHHPTAPNEPQQKQQSVKKPKKIRVKKEDADASETTSGTKRKSGGAAVSKRSHEDNMHDEKQPLPNRPAPALRLPAASDDMDDDMQDEEEEEEEEDEEHEEEESNSSVSDADPHQDFSAFPSKTLEYDMNDDVGGSSAHIRSPQALPTPSQYDALLTRQRGHPLTSSDSLPRDVFQPSSQFEAFPFKPTSQPTYTDFNVTSFYQTSASVGGMNTATPRSVFSTESTLPHQFTSFAMSAPSMSPPVITSSASSYISTASQTKPTTTNEPMDAIPTQDLSRRDSFSFFYTTSAATSMSTSSLAGNNLSAASNVPYSPFTALGMQSISSSSQRSAFEPSRENEPQQSQPTTQSRFDNFNFQPVEKTPSHPEQQMPARPTSDAELDQMLLERGQQLLQQQRMTNRLLEQLQQLQQAGMHTQQQLQQRQQLHQQPPMVIQSSFSAGGEPWPGGGDSNDLSQRLRQAPPAPMYDYPSASPPAFQPFPLQQPQLQMNAPYQPHQPSQQQLNRPHQSYPPNDYGYPMA